ncbi:MAG TPA: VWA-like domain-containing protein, partial [Alphaproteobacteria bacterium]|nr:VWA-like domain-containing protein [Alphaproteobacteria bacterium]
METNDKAAALAADRVAKARAELILERTFYGVLVSQVEPVASRQIPTMATDSRRHFYNPDFVATLSQDELLGVQAHESEHDARRHHTRRAGRDPKEWNIACDYAINPDLIDAGLILPSGALIDERFRGMSAEDIYRTRELDRQRQPQQPQPQKSDGGDGESGGEPGDKADDDQGDADGQDEGDDGEAQGESQGDADAESQDGQDGPQGGQQSPQDGEQGQGGQGSSPGGQGDQQGPQGAGGAGEGEGQEDGDGKEGDGQEAGPQSSGDPGRCGEVIDAAADAAELADQDARWERVLRQAAMLAAKRGDAPGHVMREIERSDHPPQDWRETLRAFFDGGAATTETWSRPNRRFIGGGLYLPGREREGVNRAAFLIDTSGSMDDIALAAIKVEAQAALDENVIDELVVVYGDVRVTRVDTFRPGDDIEFDPRGGGGTDMRPLFAHVASEIDASLIVCFTDGYIGEAGPEPACPVLWAFTGYPQAVREMI